MLFHFLFKINKIYMKCHINPLKSVYNFYNLLLASFHLLYVLSLEMFTFEVNIQYGILTITNGLGCTVTERHIASLQTEK